MVKVYLSQKGVEFTDYNISTDREALKNLIDMGYRTTPLTVIGDEKIIGYSPAKIDEALKLVGIAE